MRQLRYFILLFGLFATGSCFGFGHMAHRVICAAAFDMLSDTEKQQIDQLITTMPSAYAKRLNKYQWRSENQAIGFADSCVWPDAVKRSPEFQGTQTWHYVNVSRTADKVRLADCLAGCLLSALDLHLDILQQADDPWVRAQALMFFSHWLADLHQPMHVSFADDRGGNQITVSGYGENCGDLHRVWDYCMIEKVISSDQELLAAILSPDLKVSIGSANNNFMAWANESLAISRTPTVRYCQLEGNLCARNGTKQALTLGDEYQRQNWPILQRRMSQAAVRLAGILSATF